MPAPTKRQARKARRQWRQIATDIAGQAWAILPEHMDRIIAATRAPLAEVRGMFGDEDRQAKPQKIGEVAYLPLQGMIVHKPSIWTRYFGATSCVTFGRWLQTALADDEIKTIWIDVDSPGGMLYGVRELAQQIYDGRQKKRIVALSNPLMASAAYWIASAAAEVWVTPSSATGHIGAILVHTEVSKADEEFGYTRTVFSAGKHKADGNPYEALDAQARQTLQGRVDDNYAMFVADVARNRAVQPAAVRGGMGQARILYADQAVAEGVADRVATLEDFTASIGLNQAPRRLDNTDSSTSARVDGNYSIGGHFTMKVTQRIRAALFAASLIAAFDADDSVCLAAIGGLFAGGTVPEDEGKILARIARVHVGEEHVQTAATVPAPAAAATPSEPPPAASSVQAARDQEVAEARAAERKRIADLEAKAEQLRESGLDVSRERVTAAINAGHDVATAVMEWTSRPSQRTEQPVGRVEPQGSEVDNFAAAACDGLILRAMNSGQVSRRTLGDSWKPAAGAAECARMRAVDMARRDLTQRGVSIRGATDDEDVAKIWLRQGGEYNLDSFGGNPFDAVYGVTGMDGSPRYAAQYPNFLGAFVSRIAVMQIMLQRVRYREWTAQRPSVSDLNPRLVMAMGDLGRYDELEGDDAPTPEDRNSEQALSWFQPVRRAKKVSLTPLMVANDELGVFADNFARLIIAADRTIDDLCIDLLVANPTLLDGTALFDASRGNVAGGGAPSATQAGLVRTAMRKQKGIDTDDPIDAEPRIHIVPAALEDAAIATYYDFARLREIKNPATDATINVHRGKGEVIAYPRLDSTSALVWYSFDDPMMFPVVTRVHQTGYEQGRRESWWDPDRQVRYWRNEIRVGVFVSDWRGSNRNPGT